MYFVLLLMAHNLCNGYVLCLYISMFTLVVSKGVCKLVWQLIVILCEQTIEKNWNEGRQQTIESLEEAIKDEKTAQWRAEGQELLIQAKRENVLFQLEAAYRERLMNTYTEVYPFIADDFDGPAL